MDGAKYQDILEENLNQSVSDLRLGRRFTFRSDLKIAVHKRKPSNLKELEQFCLEEWAKIPVDRCGRLIETYEKPLAAVIAAKVVSTKY